MKEYPKELDLLDDTKVITRPIQPEDIESLCNFFSKIPRSDLNVFKGELTKWDNIKNQFEEYDYNKVSQFITLDNDIIVANGSLVSEGLFWSHAAELRLIVDPEYRGKGLGSQMFNLLLYEGLKHRFQKIIVRYLSSNVSFTKILNRYGFKPETVLSCYIKDEKSCNKEDLVIASFSLENWSRRFEFYSSLYRR